MRFDAAELPVAQRSEALFEAIDRAYYPCDTRLLSPELLRARMWAVDVGPVRSGYGDIEPMVVERSASLARRDSGDFVFIPIPLRERLQLSQRGREAWIAQDAFACTTTAEAYTYRQPQPLELLTLRIAAAAVRERVANVEDLTAIAFAARSGAGALFLDYARSFCRNVSGFDRATGATAVRHLLDLFALAVQTAGVAPMESSESAVREAQRQRILRHVEARLGDPGLTTQSVARQLGLSERYIQKLLAARSETLSGLIRQCRLAEARRILADPASRSRSVAAIAYQLGFSDPAYFSRVFREATGLPPRAFRAGN